MLYALAITRKEGADCDLRLCAEVHHVIDSSIVASGVESSSDSRSLASENQWRLLLRPRVGNSEFGCATCAAIPAGIFLAHFLVRFQQAIEHHVPTEGVRAAE